MEFIIKTFGASYEGKLLKIRVPCETWETEMTSEEKAKTACLWIRENGIPCSIPALNAFLMDV